MFAPVLALLSGLTLASAAGLRSAFTSEYGQEQGDWLLHQATPSGLVLGGAATDQLTISAKVENGELVMTCPYQGYQAVLVAVPDSDPVAYEVQFVNSFSDLPARAIFGGWSLSDDRTGIANENFTKVVNAVSRLSTSMARGELTAALSSARARADGTWTSTARSTMASTRSSG